MIAQKQLLEKQTARRRRRAGKNLATHLPARSIAYAKGRIKEDAVREG